MEKIYKNNLIFVLIYIGLCFFTYLLPYFGSNSIMLTLLSFGLNLIFTGMHISILILLIILTAYRSKEVEKNWLVVLPVLAALFDMLPFLSIIPFVPTVLHSLTLFFGFQKLEPEMKTVS